MIGWVVLIGPPPVMIRNWSNPLNEPAIERMSASINVGFTKGKVMEKNARVFLHPSISAASYISGEMLDRPASMNIMLNPNVFQATEMQMIILALPVEENQFIPCCKRFILIKK